ncbi:MAG TPA: DUF882 domain-containing protein [Polyangiaceae bacterium]
MLHRILAPAICAFASASVSTQAARDAFPPRSMHLDSKKSISIEEEAPELLGTFSQTHTDERVAIDAASPTQARFEELLADRVTGQKHAIDAKLLETVRALLRKHPGSRVEIVSGYRSEKLNETLRKKGHHVATHSQHSLGHALDFRIVLPDESRALGPLQIERELRDDLGWDGGVGVYLSESDWFTHMDTGPNRRWNGL